VTHPAAAVAVTDVERFDVQAHLGGERARPDDAGQQQTGELTIHQADHGAPARRREEGTQLVAQPISVVAAQLGADGRLLPRLEAELDEPVEVLRDGLAHQDTGTHGREPFLSSRLARMRSPGRCRRAC
jgi:hypothetical protein